MRILLYFLLILLVGCSSGQNKKTHERVDLDSVPVYTNPLLSRGGDPWAVFHNGIYYYTQSMSDRITLWATDDITRLAEASQKDVWVPQNSSNAFHLWGPEIHYINNKWYIYCCADDGNIDNRQIYVLENESADPMKGEFVMKGRISTDEDNNWAIHASTFEHGGKRYLIWCGWQKRRVYQENQCIYIAEMENPWTLASDRILISEPEYEWECQWISIDGNKTAYPIRVNEAPEALRALEELDALVNIQINSSDDNPGVILNASKEDFEKSQVAQYFVDSKDLKGAIIPSANFEPLPIAISAERAAIALAHVAHNSVQRTIRMDEDRFSGLPRYLTAESNKNGHNFGATEDSMVSIYAENVDLANPVSMDGSPVEGNIEDTASNLPRIAERLQRASSNIIDLYSMELLHATQAIDLRRAQQDGVKLSPKTEALYKAYRAKVPFVDKDRIFSEDLVNDIEILKNWH